MSSKSTVIQPEVVPYHLCEGSELSVKVDGETVWLTQNQMLYYSTVTE